MEPWYMGVQSGCVACPLDALAVVWEVAHIEAMIGSPYLWSCLHSDPNPNNTTVLAPISPPPPLRGFPVIPTGVTPTECQLVQRIINASPIS